MVGVLCVSVEFIDNDIFIAILFIDCVSIAEILLCDFIYWMCNHCRYIYIYLQLYTYARVSFIYTANFFWCFLDGWAVDLHANFSFHFTSIYHFYGLLLSLFQPWLSTLSTTLLLCVFISWMRSLLDILLYVFISWMCFNAGYIALHFYILIVFSWLDILLWRFSIIKTATVVC